LKGAKLHPKEEVEGAVTEAAGSKDKSKAPPAKKGASEVVSEITPEEEARLKKEKAIREKENAALMEEWSKIPADQQFFKYAEDNKQECHISFPTHEAAEGEEPVRDGF
jgi:hypothetical protein